MCDRGQDGTKRLEAHCDVQKMGRKEEVVIVTQNRHGHVPGQVQEGLSPHKGAHTHIYTQRHTHGHTGNIDYKNR